MHESMAALLRLNALVLDQDLIINHVSAKLGGFLSPLDSDISGEHVGSYLLTEDFESLLDAVVEPNVEAVVTLSLAKGQQVELTCQKIIVDGREWIIATTCSVVRVEAPVEPLIAEPDIFAKLVFSANSFEVLSANPLAHQLLANDCLIGMTIDQIINFDGEEFKSRLALVTAKEATTLTTSLKGTDTSVMIKVCRVIVHERDCLAAYIVSTDQAQQSQKQLAHAQQISASLFESRDCAVLMMDHFGVITRVNSMMASLLDDSNLVGKRARVALPSQLSELISTSDTSTHDVVVGFDDSTHRMQLRQQPLRSSQGGVLGLLLTLSEDVDSIDSLKYRALYAASLAADHAVFITDPKGQILFVNEVFELQTGYGANDVIDQDVSLLKNDTLGQDSYRYLWRAIKNKDTWRGILRCRKRTGISYWSDLVVNPLLDDQGETECIVWLSQDITMDKELKKTGTYLANYDVATGLANAVLAADRLEGMLGRARRRKMIVAVIYLDIGEFERLARRHSAHDLDNGLASYCDRLRDALRAEDSLARMSNGRIAVLLPDLPSVEALEVVSAKIDKVNQRALDIAGKPYHLEFKQGISYFPEQGASAESLFKNAEASLLKAWSNQNPIGCFGKVYNKKALAHFELRRELLEAIDNHMLEVTYQPVCQVNGDKIIAVEANLKWQHQKYGLIGNDEIFTLAEAGGCVQELGFSLIETICDDLNDWQQIGFSDFKVGINLSHGQLRNRHIARNIAAILERNSLSIERLALEIPISYIATQWLDLEDILQELSLMGASLQYDKFGDRGAYISDLRHFPFDGIKLSRSYIEQIDDDPTVANLIQGIIAMAISLNLKVTAVGVKDLSQLLQLQEMNCHYAQGELFNGFVSKEQMTQYLVRNTTQEEVPELP